jgi:mycofactocin precursor
MEQTEEPIHEHTNEDDHTDKQEEKDNLTFTEIDLEEVAIDGICGVY